MSDIYIERAHSFDFQTARSYAKKWLNEAKEELGLDVQYIESEHSDTASISKMGVDAKATLTADKIVFEAKLGMFAKPLKGLIESGITEGLSKHFLKS